ncbi:hypothetical protein [Brachybacterium sp. UNK5269]|uniref:hypothetical protein n=1 Tax=Brachybacterium sp. UNK5269 TaxID=3408576 RepID=UPI003BB0D1A5
MRLPGPFELLDRDAGAEVDVVGDDDVVALGADPPPGAAGAPGGNGEPGGIQQALGLRLVVLPAEQVEVLDLGPTALGRVLVVVLLEVVAFGGPGDAACASGHGAARTAQAQVLEHRPARRVALRRQGEEGPGAVIGEHAVPGVLAPGELSGHLRRDGYGPLEHARCVGDAQQAQHRDAHAQAEALLGDRYAVGVERRVELQRVAQAVQRERPAGPGDDALAVVGDLRPLAQGLALGGLDRAGRFVEALPVGEDLGDRALHGGGADPVGGGGAQRDPAQGRGRRLVGQLLPPLQELDQGAEQGHEAVDRDARGPVGDRDVQLPTRRLTEPLGLAQHLLEPPRGELAGLQQVQAAGQVVHGAVGAAQLPVGDTVRDPQRQRGAEGVEVVRERVLRVARRLQRDQLGQCAIALGEGPGAVRLRIPDSLSGRAELRRVSALPAGGHGVAGQRGAGLHDPQALGEGGEEGEIGGGEVRVVALAAVRRGAGGHSAHVVHLLSLRKGPLVAGMHIEQRFDMPRA